MGARILLADDHTILRAGLRSLIEVRCGDTVVGEAEDGLDAVRLAHELAPDLVVMDIGMPGLNGVEATRRIREQSPRVKILGLSMYHERRFVTRMFQAGATGYLLKDCAVDELQLAIRTVLAGQTYISPRVAGGLVGDYLERLSSAQGPETTLLTDREREVVQSLAEGRSSKEIAKVMGVSPKTVDTHRKRVMDKLGFRTIADLTKYAIREGLTTLDDDPLDRP